MLRCPPVRCIVAQLARRNGATGETGKLAP
jgi:hypothetical protein